MENAPTDCLCTHVGCFTIDFTLIENCILFHMKNVALSLLRMKKGLLKQVLFGNHSFAEEENKSYQLFFLKIVIYFQNSECTQKMPIS